MKNKSLGTYSGDKMVERFALCGDGMFVALIVSSRPLLTSLCECNVTDHATLSYRCALRRAQVFSDGCGKLTHTLASLHAPREQ